MKYILDTNIALIYLRKNKLLMGRVEEACAPFSEENESILCVVSIGELLSIAEQNEWSDAKIAAIHDFRKKLPVAYINKDEIYERYAEIDAYSQGKLKRLKSPLTARNMGKNDLWIAATASILEATVVTTDKDFDHLHGVFLTVIWIDPKLNNDKK
jgi:predicted nucleic acid-binding protein